MLKYSTKMCDIATNVLANGESIVAVAAELDVCRDTVYEWINTHPEFRSAIKRGLAKSQRKNEAIGMQGMTGELEKFNASAWIFTMKNRFRDDYKEKEETKTDKSSIVENLIID